MYYLSARAGASWFVCIGTQRANFRRQTCHEPRFNLVVEVQVKEGQEPAMFTAYFQAWDASRKQRTTADYDARVAALNEEADAAATAEEGAQPEAEAQPEEAAEPAEADSAPADEPCALPLPV